MIWIYHHFDMAWSQFIKMFTWKMVSIDQGFYIQMVWIDPDFLHSKWSELIRIFTWQMVWINQDYYMAKCLNCSGFLHGKWSELISDFLDIENGLNWSQFSHSKWIDLIMILTRNMVWIDKGLRWEMVWIIMSLTWQIVWNDQDFYMANVFELIRIVAWQMV